MNLLGIICTYDIPVKEDVAEAIGSGYRGRKCKAFGKFGALCFNENQMIKTSGGGALVCRTEEEVRRPFHWQPVFKKNPYYGEDTAKRLFDKGLYLPSFLV